MTQKTLLSHNLTLADAVELIKNGADVNEEVEYGYTPLFYATTVEIVQLLIEHGADINHKNHDGYTLIHWSKYVEIIKLLITNGIKLNTLSDNGQSPVDSNHSISNLKILIDHGSIPAKIETYQKYRDYFTREQQEAFDMFLIITSNNTDFFHMCLAYQEGLNNSINHKIKDVELDI